MGDIAKNDIDFFDKVHDGYVKHDGVAKSKALVAFQAFMQKPKKQVTKIQASGVSTDFAILTKDAFNVTLATDNFDMGWERAFRQVTLGRGQDSWEIYDVANGITFSKVEEGQRIALDKLSGTKTTGYVDYYGGALGWTDKMIRFRRIPAMVDKALAFRNKFWTNKADNHYTLIAAAAAGNVTAY